MCAVEMQDTVDQFIRGNSQKAARLAGEFYVVLLKNASEGPMLLQNLLARRLWKKREVDLDRAEFHRLFAAFKEQRHFAKIVIASAQLAHDPQMNRGAMMVLQCRRHVVLMDEQRLIWLRNRFGVHFLQRGEQMAIPIVKVI